MSQKIFKNDLVAIRKSRVTLTLKKSAYVKYNEQILCLCFEQISFC